MATQLQAYQVLNPTSAISGLSQVTTVKPLDNNPLSKVHAANMGPNWGRQDPGGPHGGPMNFATWEDRFFQSLSELLANDKP